MAKRFTDTGKWDKQSFADLSMKMKLVWVYLCDKCDHAGVWDINTSLISFQIGTKVTIEEMVEGLNNWIEVRGSKILLTNFIDFQYGALNPENRVHQSVISRIEKLAPYKDLASPLQGAKDKDKDKDMDKDKDSLGESEGVTKIVTADLDAAYRKYPRKQGKSIGMNKLRSQIKSSDDLVSLNVAIDNYRAHCERNGTEPQFIKQFSSFVSEWRDWLEPGHGTTVTQTKSKTWDVMTAPLRGVE